MISLRTDPEIDVALAILGATAGNRSQIVRSAILDAAERHKQDVPPSKRNELMAELLKALKEGEQ